MTLTEAISKLTHEEFAFIIKNGKRSSELIGYDLETITKSSYKFVNEIAPDLIKNAKFDELLYKSLRDRGYNVFFYEIENANKNKLLESFCWIYDELKEINLLEEAYLNTPPDPKLMMAGIDRMNVFGITNIVDSLAGGDILKWEQIKELPYHMVFDKQYKTAIENDIQKRLVEINKVKSK